ncbi:asparagine synthase-related protein [Kocuria palustris]|uniref:asparagine synthase-related protein n=1 Tax=Kocuria palustris TaxID=71999 RepID=UPI0021A5A7D1|nr:asparagine synthase-related protein [Kocuria palustris]MCT1833286.1 asparagine synthase-related protein [Kocuria palustris]MDH5150854.1 asparagine synthase-related protein [Kocuria palustris]
MFAVVLKEEEEVRQVARIKTFVIALPDDDNAAGVMNRITTRVTHRLNYPSGRPWLVMSLPIHAPFLISSDQTAVVIGPVGMDQKALDRCVNSVHSPVDFARMQRDHAGSFSVFATCRGALYASGPALETRRVFRADIDGVPILSDRADVLADLGGFAMDHTTVALRLSRGVPHPFDGVSMWQGISPIPGGEYVVVDEDNHVETRTWWSRPEPVLNRADGARLLREAIAEAVAVRVPASGPLACDLSGGLDSTPLCYFAAQASNELVAGTFFTEDPGGREDLEWAERALPAMPSIREHVVFSTAGIPGFYEDLYDLGIPLDEPTQAGGTIPRVRHMLNDDAKRDISVHINGLGGDHLFRGVRAWNHTLAKSRPALAWSRARAEDIPSRVPAITTARQLADRRSYRRWLRDTIEDAARGIAPPQLPRSNDWSVPLSMPSWLSVDGREAVLEHMRSAVDQTDPLAGDLARHFDLFTVKQAGRLARSMGLIGDALGVSYDAPLLDDRVVETAFAVRYEERDTPVEWKPLIKEAMKGLLPEAYLRRTNKIGGATQAVRGYAANFDILRALWQDSGLLDAGFIDSHRLFSESAPSKLNTPPSHIHALTDTAIFMQSQQSSDSLEFSPHEELK